MMLSLPVRTASGIGVWVGIALCVAIAAAPVNSADTTVKAKEAPTATKQPTPAAPAPSIPKPAAPPKEVEIEAEIDLPKLLIREMVFPQTAAVTDGIWVVPVSDGRMIVRIPFKVTTPESPVIASGTSIKVRGGRFVCWQLFDPKEEASKTLPPAAITAVVNPTGTDALPINVPRMTRAVQIEPDGTIAWKMDRTISGAKVVESQAPNSYIYKLNSAALDKLNPGNPPRTVKNAGESPADFIKRKQPIDEEYRKKLAVYNDAKKQLVRLPDEFKGPAPKTLWAVFETRANARTLELEGPAPLPWEFPVDLLLQLQRMVMGGEETPPAAGTSTLSFATAPVEENISKVLSDAKVNPLSLRLIATAMTNSKYLDNMEDGDAKYLAVEKVLGGRDSVATAEIMKYLAVKPSKASASLMKKAITAGLLDAKAQLSSLIGMLDAAVANPAGIDNAILTINQYLADPKGPPAKEALAPLFALARKQTTIAPAINKALRIEATDARRDEVVISIIEAAVSDPIATGVLDTKLLGSEDATLQERTLYLLGQAVRPKMDIAGLVDVSGKPLNVVSPQTKLVVVDFWTNATAPGSPIAQLQKLYSTQGVAVIGINVDKERSDYDAAMRDQKFTWPQVWEGKTADTLQKQWGVTAPPATFILSPTGQMLWRGTPRRAEVTLGELLAGTSVSTVADPGPKPVIVNDIPIRDVQENIFRLLGDSKLRNLAWGALQAMRMAPAIATSSADRAKWPLMIVDRAVAQTPTPVASARFLAKHEEPGIVDGLVQLVIRAEADASVHASKALLGSGLALNEVLGKLPNEENRHSFGIRFYENIVKEAPYSVGLLRDKSESVQVLTWFGKQVAGGTLPSPARWVQAYQSADRVAELIAASDEDLALGALGTLVASAGGDGADTQEAAQKLRANKNAGIAEAVKGWGALRKEIFAKKLKNSSTTYQLTYRIGDVSKEGDVTWSRVQPAGPVAMKIEGANVTLNNTSATVATDDSLSLHMKAADITKLTTGTASLASDSKDKPIVIQPEGATGWFAVYNLADGRRVELMLESKK